MNQQPATSNKTTLTVLFVFLFNLFIIPMFSQEENGIEPLPKWKNTVIFDRFGNKYKLKEIDLNPKRDLLGENILSSQVISCNAGIFELYFETGSGMEDVNDIIHNQRRDVVCKVFSDISTFLQTPLHISTTRVRIWVRNINQLPNFNSDVLGLATGYYCVPGAPTIINGGIADNEIWKTINSGTDSYTNVQNPIVSTNNSNPTALNTFYHGMIAINPNKKWNTNLQTNTTYSQIDLYTVVLHEVTHALGFASLISQTGESNFGANFNYYSRYDTFLKSGTTNLISNTNNACSHIMYDYENNTLNYGLPSCSNLGSNINNTVCANSVHYNGSIDSPIYTPHCFEKGSSLSHFEDLCYINPITNSIAGNDLFFVMSNANRYGIDKRFYTNEERLTLNDIGYTTQSSFGDSTTLNGTITYTNASDGIRIAAINDGVSNTLPVFSTPANTPITVTGILNNDFSFEIINNVLTSTPQNLRFECVQDLYDTNSIINHTGNLANGSITFQSPNVGIHVLRYVPYNNVTGNRGNIAYIYVNVSAQDINGINNNNYNVFNCGTPINCDLVINGGFENKTIPPNGFNQIYRACNWQTGNQGTADYFRTDATNTQFGIPNNNFGSQNVSNTSVLNNGYAGIITFSNFDPASRPIYNEIICTRLKQPLSPNTQYQLTFEYALSLNSNPFSIQAFLSPNPPNIFSTGNFTVGSNDILVNNPTISNGTGWQTVTLNIDDTGNGGQLFLYIGAISNPIYTQPNPQGNLPSFPSVVSASHYYIDNVSLMPIDNTIFNLPPTICNRGMITDLSDYILNADPNGTFSGVGVINTNDIFSFNPIIAGIGNHIIEYTVNSANGCPSYTIIREIEVIAVCAKPFISQTYAKGTESTYIEIKNPSITETIFAGSYFAVLYDGVSTNGIPTSSFDIGAFLPGEVKVFQNLSAQVPNYATIGLHVFPINFTFDGQEDILVLSRSNGSTAYNDRVDLVGRNSPDWCADKSLVRTNCAVSYPRIDAFDLEDWVEFTLEEIENEYGENSKTNAVLGRHNDDALTWNTSWTDGSTDESNPDRSRRINIANNYNTALDGGSFEACSLTVFDDQTLTIAAKDYVSSEGFVNVQDNAIINVLNNGSLVQVKDEFQGAVGTDLINRGINSQINISRTTVGLDAFTDYVYWGTPLANIPANNGLNTKQHLFAGFSNNRFYHFNNQNFQDIPNFFSNPNAACFPCDGYDDNLDDYQTYNGELMAGQGYVTWPPSGCGGGGCNYTINFSGTPNNGVVTVPVYYNAPSNSFVNLISNPYPSGINLDRVFELNAGLIEPYALIWGRQDDTPTGANGGPYPLSYTEDNYLIYNPTMTIIPNSNGNGIFNDLDFDGISDNSTLASCQSFFVNSINDGDLVFDNSVRTKEENNTFARQTITKPDVKNKLWINLETENQKSQIGIAFLDTASDNYSNNEDVKKIYNKNLNLYTKTTNFDLVIDAQNTFNTDKIIPLGINSNNISNTFLLKIDKVNGELINNIVYLEDKLLNKIHNLTEESYSFTLDSLVTNDRFVLLFKNGKSNIRVYSNETNSQPDTNGCWKEITSTSEHTLGIRTDGTLWGWGFNQNGQLSTAQCDFAYNCPDQMLLSNEQIWNKVATGYRNSFALKNNGTIFSFGDNNGFSLGLGITNGSNVYLPTQIGVANDWLDIKTFSSTVIAKKQNGSLWGWGGNGSGQIGDGSIVSKNSPVQIGTDTDWAIFTVGNGHSASIKNNGSLWIWGNNAYGQLGDGTNINKSSPITLGNENNWLDVSAGWRYTLAVKTDGTLWAWGSNYNGQLGSGSFTDSILPVQVGVDTNWQKVYAGSRTSFAIKSNGTLWAWGENSSYQLCNGTTADGNSPIQIGANSNWKEVTGKGISTLAMTNDNSIYVWGTDNFGQLGLGSGVGGYVLQTPTLMECLQLSNDKFIKNNITIYPNPTKNTLNIETNNLPITKIIISDMLGKKVLEQNSNASSLNVQSLQKGIYILQVFSEYEVFNSKFVKE